MSDTQLTQQRIKDTLGTINSLMESFDDCKIERAETRRLYGDLKDWILWAQDMDHVTDDDIWHVICHDLPICCGFGGEGSLPKSSGGARETVAVKNEAGGYDSVPTEPSAYTKKLEGKERDDYIAKRFTERRSFMQ